MVEVAKAPRPVSGSVMAGRPDQPKTGFAEGDRCRLSGAAGRRGGHRINALLFHASYGELCMHSGDIIL